MVWCPPGDKPCSEPTMANLLTQICVTRPRHLNGPLAKCVKLRVAHAPGIPGTFSPPQTSREPASYQSRHASRTCVTHVPRCMSGSLTRGGGENVPGISGACATRHFTYLVRDPLAAKWTCPWVPMVTKHFFNPNGLCKQMDMCSTLTS